MKTRNLAYWFLGVLLFAYLTMMPHLSWAAYEIFVSVEGIKGESTDDRHKNWIQALSYRSDVKFDSSINRPSFGNVGVAKRIDRASPKLSYLAAMGSRIHTVVIEFVRASEESQLFFRITLDGARITSTNSSGTASGESLPVEMVFFKYEIITWEYWPSGGSKIKVSWNVIQDCRSNQICKGDFDVEGDVDGADLVAFLISFGSSLGDSNYYPPADLNDNNRVDEDDLDRLGPHFGRTDCIECLP